LTSHITFGQCFRLPKGFLPLALERSKQIKPKKLDAGTFFDDAVGDVNSDEIDG
jgi:hypothetical protein